MLVLKASCNTREEQYCPIIHIRSKDSRFGDETISNFPDQNDF